MVAILITGPPAIGKSTLIQNLANRFQKSSIITKGFITKERRNGHNSRTGFDLVDLNSNLSCKSLENTPLATVSSDVPGHLVKKLPKVGKYSVHLGSDVLR